jgi:hypothetical protein
MMLRMLIPILIFVACFGGGAAAAARWLPDLGPGSVAGLAFVYLLAPRIDAGSPVNKARSAAPAP